MSAEIAAHIRRLWRHRGTTLPTPRRGPRQQLDLDEILDAAVTLADAEGLTAVSTRAVAARFGKTAMALYPYVGSKEQFLALMQDHASAPPPTWPELEESLAGSLSAWAFAFFDLHVTHPWLTELPLARSSQGPHERDWMERLQTILTLTGTPPASRSPTTTMLYAVVRACAESDTTLRRTTTDEAEAWRAQQSAIPDLATRYPHTAALPPITTDWREAPRAGLQAAVDLLATALRS